MDNNKINWVIHIEFAILFVTLIGGFYTIDTKFDRCHERTDKLYEMHAETQKDYNHKFYDLLRDRK